MDAGKKRKLELGEVGEYKGKKRAKGVMTFDNW